MAKPKPTMTKDRRKQKGGHSDDEALERAFQANRAHAGKQKAYELRESSLHGLGVHARRQLRPGDTVLSERVLLERPYDLLDGNKATPAFAKFFDDIRRLSYQDKTDLLDNMANNKNWYFWFESVEQLNEKLKARLTLTSDTTLQLATTFRQHSFPFCGNFDIHRLFSGDVHMLNHSCTPNAEAVWNPETRRLNVRAVKVIGEKEEVTISYVDPCREIVPRLRHLGFACDCTECHLTGEALYSSDTYRTMFRIALRGLRDFRMKFFGGSEDLMILTPAKARMISNMHERERARAMQHADHVNEIGGESKLRYSGFALAREVLYVLWMAKAMTADAEHQVMLAGVAMQHKKEEIEFMSVAFGLEHPRTQALIAQLKAMRTSIPGGEELGVEKLVRSLTR